MDPKELVRLIEIMNPDNKPGRITVITRMGAENMRVKLPHLIRAVRKAGQFVTWISDPMHGNTIKAPCGLKTRPFDAILVRDKKLLPDDRLNISLSDNAFHLIVPLVFDRLK